MLPLLLTLKRRFINLGISSKIALAVVVMIFTSITFGAITVNRLEGVDAAAEQIRAHWLPRSHTFAQMLFVAQRFRLVEAALLNAPTADQNIEMVRIELDGHQLQAIFAKQREMATSHFETLATEAMAVNWRSYLDLHKQLVAYLAAGDTASATALYRDDMRDLMRRFQDQIWNEETGDIAAGELAAALSETLGSQARLDMYIMIAGALAMSLAIGFSLAGGVAKPVRAITRVMTELVHDRPEVEIPYLDFDNEFGQMARAAKVFKNAQAKRTELVAYVDEHSLSSNAEHERAVAECLQAHAELAEAMHRLGSSLQWFADGNANHQLVTTISPDDAATRTDVNLAIARLKDAMQAVSLCADGVLANPNRFTKASADHALTHDRRAPALTTTAASLTQISDEISNVARRSADAASHARDILAAAEEAVKENHEVSHDGVTIDAMAKSYADLSRLIDMIDEIAFQSNLLVLNAGAEAQHADHRGVAARPVASEVRSLALRSAEAAKQISNFILSSTGVKFLADTMTTTERATDQQFALTSPVQAITAMQNSPHESSVAAE